MQNQTDELLDQVINAAAAIQKAKDQCAFLERALQEATDRLDVASATAGNGQADEMSRAEWVDFLDIQED